MNAGQMPGSWPLWVGGAALFVVVLVSVVLLWSFALRKFLNRGEEAKPEEFAAAAPKSSDAAAFMTASLQAVIKKQREQEKELERLHRLEKERAQQTERLSEAVTRNMPAGLLVVSAAGLITSANPAAETALGIRALAYRRAREVFGAESPLTRMIDACLAEGKTFRREEIDFAATKEGARRLGVTISPIRQGLAGADAAKGKVTGALCLLTDLTELTALQKQMSLRENLAALGEMSAGIAHEFKNALATISGYAQMMRSEAPAGELRESAGKILSETRALTHVVTEFLRFARPLEFSSEAVELGPVVERVTAEVEGAVAGVRVEAEGEFGEVSGDDGLLRQAFLNLVRNAAEAAATGPRSAAAQVVVRGTVEEGVGGTVQRVTVADNGPGIGEADLPKIFLPFYTTKADGTGLGLAVVQKIVLQHGGTVQARNLFAGAGDAAAGAEFIVTLPLRARAGEGAAEGVKSEVRSI